MPDAAKWRARDKGPQVDPVRPGKNNTIKNIPSGQRPNPRQALFKLRPGKLDITHHTQHQQRSSSNKRPLPYLTWHLPACLPSAARSNSFLSFSLPSTPLPSPPSRYFSSSLQPLHVELSTSSRIHFHLGPFIQKEGKYLYHVPFSSSSAKHDGSRTLIRLSSTRRTLANKEVPLPTPQIFRSCPPHCASTIECRHHRGEARPSSWRQVAPWSLVRDAANNVTVKAANDSSPESSLSMPPKHTSS